MSGHNMPTSFLTPEWTYPDPGNGGTINPPHSAQVLLDASASAETRILRAPQTLGQCIILTLRYAGGGTITVTGYDDDGDAAREIGEGGDATAAFATEGDTAMFVAADIGGSLYWRQAATVGATVS